MGGVVPQFLFLLFPPPYDRFFPREGEGSMPAGEEEKEGLIQSWGGHTGHTGYLLCPPGSLYPPPLPHSHTSLPHLFLPILSLLQSTLLVLLYMHCVCVCVCVCRPGRSVSSPPPPSSPLLLDSVSLWQQNLLVTFTALCLSLRRQTVSFLSSHSNFAGPSWSTCWPSFSWGV